jgi:hypothetical protein
MKEVIDTLIIFCIFIGLAIWGCWELIDYFFIEDVIRSTKIIKPEIELIVKDNIIDTIYVYRKK